MDLRLYLRVLARHKLVLVVGLVLALVLAVLSYYRVDAIGMPPSLEPRKAEIWQSQASVFLTESGFPAGRRTNPLVTKQVGGQTVTVPRYNAPGSFTGLSPLYARLAVSDEVRRRIAKKGPPFGQFTAAPSVEGTSGLQVPLPIVSLFGKATSANGARVTVARGLAVFLTYVAERQSAAGIPKNQRVQLRVLNAPQPAVLLEPRKKTLPIVVFLGVMIAAIAIAFVLENASRSRAPVEVVAEPERERQPELEPEPEQEVSTIRRWA